MHTGVRELLINPDLAPPRPAAGLGVRGLRARDASSSLPTFKAQLRRVGGGVDDAVRGLDAERFAHQCGREPVGRGITKALCSELGQLRFHLFKTLLQTVSLKSSSRFASAPAASEWMRSNEDRHWRCC